MILILCQPIRDEYDIVLTNQRWVWYCVNQSVLYLLDIHHQAQLTQPSSALLLTESDDGMGRERSWNVSLLLDTLLQVRHWTLDWRAPSNISVRIDLSTNQRLELHISCQPIRFQYYIVSTNQRLALYCINQSKFSITCSCCLQSWPVAHHWCWSLDTWLRASESCSRHGWIFPALVHPSLYSPLLINSEINFIGDFFISTCCLFCSFEWKLQFTY